MYLIIDYLIRNFLQLVVSYLTLPSSCLTIIGQVSSLLDAVVKTTKISRTLQATRGSPSDGAGPVWFQFGTVE